MKRPFEVSEPFRLNLRRLRRRSGLSPEQLAARASLHRLTIGLLENGERLPRIDTLVKLAAGLEVTPNDLLAGIEWLPPIEEASERAKGTFRMRSPIERHRALMERAAKLRARQTRTTDVGALVREARDELERRGDRSDG